jgi:hypothetical protein
MRRAKPRNCPGRMPVPCTRWRRGKRRTGGGGSSSSLSSYYCYKYRAVKSDAQRVGGVGLACWGLDCLRTSCAHFDTNRASLCSVPGRGVRAYVAVAVAGEAPAPHVHEPKSFDDCEKKKIIAESVRTSSVGSGSEGSGLWLGRFVRRSWCAAGCWACSILDSVFNTGFACTISAVFRSVNSIVDPVVD